MHDLSQHRLASVLPLSSSLLPTSTIAQSSSTPPLSTPFNPSNLNSQLIVEGDNQQQTAQATASSHSHTTMLNSNHSNQGQYLVTNNNVLIATNAASNVRQQPTNHRPLLKNVNEISNTNTMNQSDGKENKRKYD
jgi:hypothetical protein